MNMGAIICIILAVFFLVLTLIFALSKSRGAMFISGFNTLPKKQREMYDKKKMSVDYRNMFALWSAMFFVGALLSQLISMYLVIIVFIIWVTLLFKGVHLDVYKAFEKYKIEK